MQEYFRLKPKLMQSLDTKCSKGIMGSVEKIDWEKVALKLGLWMWLVSAGAIAVGVGVWLAINNNLPPQIPLFYSRPWGEEQLSPKWGLFIPLAATVALTFLVNFVILPRNKDRILGSIVCGALSISQILLLLGTIRSIVLVL